MAVTDGRIEAIDGDGGDAEAFLQCEFPREMQEKSAIATAEIQNTMSIADNGLRGGEILRRPDRRQFVLVE
nr:hypothetical protein [Burkholderia ambifaria]WDR87374.1 hypothetical protein OR986_01760 [Burkholderia ambifaria]WDS00072.1 hypothetical protein OR985_06710 [Burkholderia ambifaria]